MDTLSFRATIWRYPGPGGWCFVTLPADLSHRMRDAQVPNEGWGRLKVTARIGQTEWQTSAWFDAKSGLYQLPIKASVRQAEHTDVDSDVTVSIMF
jgi:hypothetical protein